METKSLMAATALALFSATLVFAHAFEAADLRIGHPWARPTAPGASVGAGYLTVMNKGAEPDRLIAAASPAAGRVELHTIVMDGEIMQMRPVEGYDVPAGGMLTLAPGGNHLMLMDLVAPLVEGARVPATLTFEKAGTVAIEFAVEKQPAPAEMIDHGAMDHGTLDHGGH